MTSLSQRISSSGLRLRMAPKELAPKEDDDENDEGELLTPLRRLCCQLLRFEGDLEASFTAAAAWDATANEGSLRNSEVARENGTITTRKLARSLAAGCEHLRPYKGKDIKNNQLFFEKDAK